MKMLHSKFFAWSTENQYDLRGQGRGFTGRFEHVDDLNDGLRVVDYLQRPRWHFYALFTFAICTKQVGTYININKTNETEIPSSP